MSRVKLLDKHTAELIAAGEVVERPSSIVKELLENAIDAGATAVTVEIQGGGVRYIRITDDGEGISREDVPTAFLRHATSKISTGSDLESIGTLGFRGEALASICAISRVEVVTRSADEELGTHYVIEGGDEVAYDECGCAKGTTIVVRDVFYNTPARMKFLKKDVAEGNAVAALCDRIALSHPEVSIRLIREGKETLFTSGDGRLISAIYSVFGKEFASGLIPVDYTISGGSLSDKVRVSGYVSKPQNARPNRMMQVFFINGRYCRSRTMQAALEEAFKGSLMVGKFPACVLGLEVDCAAVDVNVHPAKLEVRFTNERPVFDGVYYAVKSALSQRDTRKEMQLSGGAQQLPKTQPSAWSSAVRTDVSGKRTGIFAPPPTERAVQTELPIAQSQPQRVQPQPTAQPRPMQPAVTEQTAPQQTAQQLPEQESFVERASVMTEKTVGEQPPAIWESQAAQEQWSSVQPTVQTETVQPTAPSESVQPTALNEVQEAAPQAVEQTEAQTAPPIAQEPQTQPEPTGRLIGEAFATYIIVEEEDKLIFIDKHAAHERLIYEQLLESGAGREPQMLLEPIQITMDKRLYATLLDHADEMLEAGFEIEDFGVGTVLVRSVPSVMADGDIQSTVLEIAGNFGKKKNALMTERMENMYHTIACRSAIKAHDRTLDIELRALVERLRNNPDVRYCPHGRPIFITVTRREIEKNFGRIV